MLLVCSFCLILIGSSVWRQSETWGGRCAGLDNETDCTGGGTYAQWRFIPGKAPPAHPYTYKLPTEARFCALSSFHSAWSRD